MKRLEDMTQEEAWEYVLKQLEEARSRLLELKAFVTEVAKLSKTRPNTWPLSKSIDKARELIKEEKKWQI